MRIVSENEFRSRLKEKLSGVTGFDFVTGPGRSGAVAAVYASHFLAIPYIPFKFRRDSNVLIVDTAVASGRTLRKASNYYGGATSIYMFDQPEERLRFWYEELSLSRGKGREYAS